ncbi:zinc-ribbon domain-containing protein [Lactiplantibacillus plantarum]|nr:zinc-ribbon domain-containing protein [Lactiplantibacillus plantarum]
MYCPNCGKKNDIDALFCENCGARLIIPASSAQPTPASAVSSAAQSTSSTALPGSTERQYIDFGCTDCT